MSVCDQFMLGDYRVGRSIGEGTFCKVRLARHLPSGQHVAVKTLQKEKIVQQADIERVTREICILKELRHVNIIQLFQIIETSSDIHLVMEYAQGELFDEIIRCKRFEDRQACRYLEQILNGVEYIHRHGIIHRDLKPQNLLLDEKLNVKIADFGLSNHYQPGQKLKTACGSPCYAAPEMIAGKLYEGLPADIWSCGIILYAMLCGYLPFEDPNTSKLYKKIIAGSFEIPRKLTQEAKQLISRILDVNPATRFSIKQIRASSWFRLNRSGQGKGSIIGEHLEINEELMVYMDVKRYIDSSTLRAYLLNNRHNSVTTHYYLLCQKMLNDYKFAEEVAEIAKKSNSCHSPLISYADKKKQIGSGIETRRDREDSFNASRIIHYFVNAIRDPVNTNANSNNLASRLLKKNDNFDRVKKFKLFPKKQESSIYEPKGSEKNHSAMTSRTRTDQKQVDKSHYSITLTPVKNQFENINFRPSLPVCNPNIVFTHPSTPSNYVLRQEQLVASRKRSNTEQTKQLLNGGNRIIKNVKEIEFTTVEPRSQMSIKRRQEELSEQLKKISFKIDQTIIGLRQHNNRAVLAVRQSIQNGTQPFQSNLLKLKTQSNGNTNRIDSFSVKNSNVQHIFSGAHDFPKTQRGYTFTIKKKENINKMNQTFTLSKLPKCHIDPFNSNCLFLENPLSLFDRIINFMNKEGVNFQQIGIFNLRLFNQGEMEISVATLNNVQECSILLFTNLNPLIINLIEELKR